MLQAVAHSEKKNECYSDRVTEIKEMLKLHNTMGP